MDEYQHSEEGGEMDEYLQQKLLQQQQVNEYLDHHDQQVHHQDIPELIIFNILIRIPAELLFSKFRSVCRYWLDIISSPLFVEQLLNYSKPSLLLQFPPRPYYRSKIRPTQIRIKKEELDQLEEGGGHEREVEILNNKINNHLCPVGRIRASCNGLLLTHDPIYPQLKMLVFNPATHSMHTIPKCLSGCKHITCSLSLAFDSSTDTYKVVHMYADQFGFEIYNLDTATTTTTTGSDDVQHSKKGKKKKKNRRKKKIPRQVVDDNDNDNDNDEYDLDLDFDNELDNDNDDHTHHLDLDFDNELDNDNDDHYHHHNHYQVHYQNLNLNHTHDDNDGTYSWRKVPGPFESIYDRPFNAEKFCWSDATMVNSKFLHWKVDSKDYIISMDVSDEISRKTLLPQNHEAFYNLERLDYTLVEMGGYLAIMFGVQHDLEDGDGKHSSIVDQLDFWILKDFEKGIWMKRLSISMECINFVKCQPQLDMLRPRGCLEDGEVIVFERISFGSSSVSSGLYVYDVESSSMKKVAMKMKLGGFKVVAYQSCLTSWTKESKRVIDAGVRTCTMSSITG